MKKLIRLLIIEVAVIVVLAAAFVLLLINPSQNEAESYVFADKAITDVTSVQVVNTSGTISVITQDGGFMIEGVPSELVDINGFIEFLTAFAEVSALQKVDSDQRELSEYGLSEPQSQVAVTFSDGSMLELQVGNQEPLSGNYYCTVTGKEGVYLLKEETVGYYLMVKEGLISFVIVPELVVSSPLSAVQDITFTGGSLKEPVTIESVSAGDEAVKEQARSFGAATHIVRGAGVYELDQTYALEILTPLCGLSGQAVVYYGLTAEQEASMGFAQPYMQVEFDYKNGTEQAVHYNLRFLKATEDGSYFYVNAEGSGTVFLIERPAFIDVSYEKLLLRWFVSPLLMDVSGITVETGSARYDFAIDNTDAKNPVVTLNGEAVDTTLFRSLFQLLNSAASDGDYLGVQELPDAEPVMTVTYHYTEGKGDDVVALYSGGTRRVNVYVNGVCEFAMKDSFAERVTQALTAIQAGESFDINW